MGSKRVRYDLATKQRILKSKVKQMFRELHKGSKITKKSKKMTSLSSKTGAEGEEMHPHRNRRLKTAAALRMTWVLFMTTHPEGEEASRWSKVTCTAPSHSPSPTRPVSALPVHSPPYSSH